MIIPGAEIVMPRLSVPRGELSIAVMFQHHSEDPKHE